MAFLSLAGQQGRLQVLVVVRYKQELWGNFGESTDSKWDINIFSAYTKTEPTGQFSSLYDISFERLT